MILHCLLDENVALELLLTLRGHDPELTVWVVGDPGAPPRGTPDPDILRWCDEHDFVLVTNNRRTMPEHLSAHLNSGRHIPGILLLTESAGLSETVELLHLAVHASHPDEHRDQIRYRDC